MGFPFPSFPDWMLPDTIGIGDISKSAGQFYTVALNLGILFAIVSAGLAMVLVVKGYIEQNPQQVNEARTSLISSFIAMVAIVLFRLDLVSSFSCLKLRLQEGCSGSNNFIFLLYRIIYSGIDFTICRYTGNRSFQSK